MGTNLALAELRLTVAFGSGYGPDEMLRDTGDQAVWLVFPTPGTCGWACNSLKVGTEQANKRSYGDGSRWLAHNLEQFGWPSVPKCIVI